MSEHYFCACKNYEASDPGMIVCWICEQPVVTVDVDTDDVRGEDTLTVIRRWECPNDAEHVIRTAAAPEGVERWRCYGCRVDAVEVEYVPRTDDRGAVEALRDIAKVDAIDAALDPQRPLRIAKAWLREHPERGGQ